MEDEDVPTEDDLEDLYMDEGSDGMDDEMNFNTEEEREMDYYWNGKVREFEGRALMETR